MSGGIQLKELTVILVVVLILFLLLDRLPGLMAGIVSHGFSHAGIGTFGAGTALAVGGLASAAGSVAAHHMGGALHSAAEMTAAKALFERIRAGQAEAALDSTLGDAVLAEATPAESAISQPSEENTA